MKINPLGALALAALMAPPALAAASPRTFEGITRAGNQLEIRTSDGAYLVTPYSERILETSFIPRGEQTDSHSHAVVLAPAPVRATLTEHADRIDYATAGISVTIWRAPFRLAYSYKGHPLLAEQNGYLRGAQYEMLDFAIDPAEALYGGGA